MEIAPMENQALIRKTVKKPLFAKKNKISNEDTEIITSLNKTAHELWFAQKSFELANDDALIDSFAYEILALNKRYEYYIRLCKERGLVAEGIRSRH